MNSLFEELPSAFSPVAAPGIIDELEKAYAAQLINDPPIASCAAGNKDRIANARRYAKKDITRALAACEKAGLMIVRKS